VRASAHIRGGLGWGKDLRSNSKNYDRAISQRSG
jgi:hypothetical protein